MKEVRFLGDFWEVMRHAHYKFLGRQEWEKALSEDFMVGASIFWGVRKRL